MNYSFRLKKNSGVKYKYRNLWKRKWAHKRTCLKLVTTWHQWRAIWVSRKYVSALTGAIHFRFWIVPIPFCRELFVNLTAQAKYHFTDSHDANSQQKVWLTTIRSLPSVALGKELFCRELFCDWRQNDVCRVQLLTTCYLQQHLLNFKFKSLFEVVN
jgi:hypothetical protein